MFQSLFILEQQRFTESGNYFDEARDVTVTGSGISLSAITYVVSPLGNLYRTVYGADSDTSIYIPSLQLSPGGWDYYLVVTNPYGDGTYIAIGMVTLYIQCTDVCSN